MTDDDRKLLEAAARAAGIVLFAYTWDKGAPWGEHEGFTVAGEGPEEWNPLESDEQAFRLAVKLRIDVNFDAVMSETVTAYMIGHNGYNQVESWGPLRDKSQDDPLAATRRAIVRSAASMAPKEGL